MKRLKYLALATLVAFAACDEGDGVVETPDPIVGSVVGSVTAEGDGVQGVTVTLTGPTSASATTGADGSFSFQNVEEGAYAVSISNIPADYVFSTTSTAVTITQDGQTATANFSGQVVRTASISGQVSADGSGVEGVAVTISGPEGDQTKQTGSAGNYQFTGLRSGSYTVSITNPDPDTYTFSNTEQNVELNAGESEVVNFGGSGSGQDATVAIESIKDITTLTEEDRDSVGGMVQVTVGVDEGGEDIVKLELFLGDSIVGTQTFASGVEGPQAVGEEFEVDFAVNTAKIMGSAPFTPYWFNGPINFRAVATDDNGNFVDATVQVTLKNLDRVAMALAASNPGGESVIIESTTGLRWLSGSLTVTVYPIIFSSPFDPNDPPIARTNFGFESFVSAEAVATDGVARPALGAAATQTTWLATDTQPGSNGEFTFNFTDAAAPTTATPTASGANPTLPIDDLITGPIGAQDIVVQTITQFGQFGPSAFCANTTTSCVATGGTTTTSPLLVFFQDELQSGTGSINNVLRVDNQEPIAGTIALNPHPMKAAGNFTAANATAAGNLRGGSNLAFNGVGYRDGWVNHDYAFDATMWGGVWSGANPLGAIDNINVYGVAPAGTPCTMGTFSTCPTVGGTAVGAATTISGIGLMPTPSDGLGYYAVASDNANLVSALTVTGIGTSRQRWVSASGTQVSTGADLPGETGIGLDALPDPNTNEWDDVSLTAIVVDRFNNAGLTNVLEVGVDGQAPIFVAGSITDPTANGTVYNTYSNVQAGPPTPFGAGLRGKTAGAYEGSTTDSGQGFSGVAGVHLDDWEMGCAPGVFVCAGDMRNVRTGVTLQTAPVGFPTATLAWSWSANVGGATPSTFTDQGQAGAPGILAYTAAFQGPLPNPPGAPTISDGYRVQQLTTWDRAGNPRKDDAIDENIADRWNNVVGNVNMPTTPFFTLGNNYQFSGETEDTVDLKQSDFAFDFHTLTTHQTYPVPGAPWDPIPAENDALGNPYVATSLQLPLANDPHTDFGSAEIFLRQDLSTSVDFLGCLVGFDEGGIGAQIHIPRGPRYRTWDHSWSYGLVNTQYNTFTPTSVPTPGNGCAATPAAVNTAFGLIPNPAAGGGAWSFTAPAVGVPTLTLSGQSGTFVPNIDVNQIDVYYVDIMGRVRLLENPNWGSVTVTDTGTGPTGRTYTWTLQNPVPADLGNGTDGLGLTRAAASSNNWFFVYRGAQGGAAAGHGLIWQNDLN